MNKHQLLFKSLLLASLIFCSFNSFSQVKQEWVARYDGPGITKDGVTDMAVDKLGNVYVTGSSATGSFTGYITTIKYDGNGNKVWGKTYRRNQYSRDIGNAITLDNEGNVYVTGQSERSEDESDFITIKYSATGSELWAKTYTSPSSIGTSFDFASDIGVDANGNIYITGGSEGEYMVDGNLNIGFELTTLKYDASGNIIWEKRSPNGIGNELALDNSGNIYVTGRNYTIKYSNNGSYLWIQPYSGVAKSIAIDAAGNVYVTGNETIKYNASGKPLWTKVSPGLLASKLTLDKNNNVYITGTVQGNTTGRNIRTVKYSTNGNWLWSKAYNSRYNLDDVASEIEVAPDGNIYVTGKSQTGEQTAEYVILKYSPYGSQLWMKTSSAFALLFGFLPQLSVDVIGNAYIAGSTPEKAGEIDFVTVKYEADGSWVWTKKFDGKGSANDVAKSLTTDADGNIYVTGRTISYQTEPGQSDFATVKFDPTGKLLWSKTYTGTMQFSASDDNANDIAVDANGNVYVVGSSIDANDQLKFTVIKYDTDGAELWMKDNYAGSAAAVAIDGAGNVYVTGAPNLTIKYAPNGNELWVNHSVGGIALKLDATGNAYITNSKNDENFKESFATYKMNTNGNLVWSNIYGNGRVADITVDNTGSTYITGWDYTANQIVTIKYSTTGSIAWTKTVDNARSNAIGVDANNNVFVTGTSNGDYITIKYNSAGTKLWSKYYNSQNNFNDEAVALVIDAQGSVYVTGTSVVNGVNGPDYSNDYATVKYDAAGNEIWVQRYNGYGNGYDEASDIALDKWNNVIVTGGSQNKNGNLDFATIKYSQTSVDAMMTQAQSNVSTEVSSSNIFKASSMPNPFVTSTNIQYILPVDGRVQINVFDVLGREVNKLVDAQQKAGNYITSFQTNSKGIYYYRITLITPNKTFQQTGKMLRE